MRQNIFLVGPMGAGKTTIGRMLSKSLRMDFLDSDQEIERRTGADIPWIFELEGESGFRDREERIIDELTQSSGLVLATGGGSVLREPNRKHLSGRGQVIYLYAPISQLLQRTRHDKSRPLLMTDNRKQKLEQLMDERDPLYREVADIVVKTGDLPVRSVVSELLGSLK